MAGPSPTLVHCTNGYPLAGERWEDVLASLGEHAAAVAALQAGGEPLPLGLYLPAAAAERLIRDERIDTFRGGMRAAGLSVRTLNGFPFARFHTPGDPLRVYRPAWDDRRRVEQSLHLAAVLVELLPAGTQHASISTLPIGWGSDRLDLTAAAANLREVAVRLARLLDRTGVRITIDLEPEPGCLLGDAAAACRFFDEHLGGATQRRHLGVCHDVCHAAVLFADQAQTLAAYRHAGIGVHKVQLTSAPDVVFDGLDEPMADEAVALLRTLPGERSLRQTSLGGEASGFFEDLGEALSAHPRPGGRWRVHHHLPLTLAGLGPLRTTRNAVAEALEDLAAHGERPLLETETYTWEALPPALRAGSLAEGLAGELAWARARIDRAWSR
ncbi:metabolite traffic protein EboE [Phycisphaera mikurensis]|uniref:Xylose isomerase-like TIM barrel domain-containing protein n=1 Tax=Phycisphaera mikurensis (strain NBRC 102666 / KCTC 22515 / FYK2301M01) TaxID=1142394 RepID=I0IF52_PHYMF|nr:metabolite traffic protein EboE [Phycisphaera mikurensis]MBB6440714.1 sugar phosphate isomerase/epimerase [Phycisphaera mikurensis]BAM03890.1 hypothetical protein PSMK_17310 [Phycisphaera mikurensis NBRC 102666]